MSELNYGVVYQCYGIDNFTAESWTDITKEQFDRLAKKGYETRILYTSPLASLTDEDLCMLYFAMADAKVGLKKVDAIQTAMAKAGRAWLEGRKG